MEILQNTVLVQCAQQQKRPLTWAKVQLFKTVSDLSHIRLLVFSTQPSSASFPFTGPVQSCMQLGKDKHVPMDSPSSVTPHLSVKLWVALLLRPCLERSLPTCNRLRAQGVEALPEDTACSSCFHHSCVPSQPCRGSDSSLPLATTISSIVQFQLTSLLLSTSQTKKNGAHQDKGKNTPVLMFPPGFLLTE